MTDLKVHVRAVISHKIALDPQRRLKPKIAKRKLKVELLRIAHAILAIAAIPVDVFIDVVEVNRECANIFAKIKVMRNAGDWIESIVVYRPARLPYPPRLPFPFVTSKIDSMPK